MNSSHISSTPFSGSLKNNKRPYQTITDTGYIGDTENSTDGSESSDKLFDSPKRHKKIKYNNNSKDQQPYKKTNTLSTSSYSSYDSNTEHSDDEIKSDITETTKEPTITSPQRNNNELKSAKNIVSSLHQSCLPNYNLTTNTSIDQSSHHVK